MYQTLKDARTALYKKYGIPGLTLVIIGLFLVVLIPMEFAAAIIFIGVAMIGLMTLFLQQKIRAFRSELLVNILNKHFEDVHFYDGKGISKRTVGLSELLPRSDRFYSNDLIEANYQGVHFKMSDVLLQEVRHNGKQTQVITIFKGPFMQINFNKDFNGKLIVKETGQLTIFSRYKSVKLESDAFNKKFHTYSTDEHSAFYILTPHMMERMLKLEQEKKGVFYFSFIDGTMYVALDNRKDYFEIPMFAKIDESISIRFERELRIITDMIEEIKLNRKIFKV